MFVQRYPLLCAREITGSFLYRDLFQIIPAGIDDPRPPFQTGAGYGLTVEVLMDERPCTDRESDTWAHDVRERQRYNTLQRKVGDSNPGWLASVTANQKMRRPSAIVREIINLLSTLTQDSFRQPEQGHVWVQNEDGGSTVAQHMSLFWPTFGTGLPDELASITGASIPFVSASDYWEVDSLSAREQVEIPDDIEELLDCYFALPENLRIAFARACELGRIGREIWLTSRSMSLVAAVFAIEGLAHAGQPVPEVCPVCNQMTSDEKCEACGTSKFGLTVRFRKFVETYVDVEGLRKRFVNDLYGFRSAIGHRAELLRVDEFDTGFTAGGSDSQWDFHDVAFILTRKALRGWLSAQPATA